MKIQALAFVTKDDGETRLSMVNKTMFNRELSDKFDDGDKVWIVVETFFNKRSLEQNNVVHWYFELISKETGQEAHIVKLILKKKFLTTAVLDAHGEQVVDVDTGEVLTEIRATSGLNSAECAKFIDEIRLWAIEFLGFELPDPEEVKSRKFR